MKNRLCPLLTMVTFATSCVTTHSSSEITKTGPLRMSCAVSDPMDSSVKLVTFTFENDSDDFFSVEAATASLKAGSGEVLDAKRSATTVETAKAKIAQQDYNTRMLLNGLLIGGGAVALASKNSDLTKVGAVTAIGAAGYGVGREINSDVKTMKQENIRYGVNHLLGEEMEIAPNLFVRKQLLVNNKNWKQDATINICFKQPFKECVDVAVSKDHCAIAQPNYSKTKV